jgi:hypothetical protein
MWAIVAFVVIPLAIMLAVSWSIQSSQRKRYEKLIEGYTDTIQRLINREPVTYKEVGKEAPEPKYERYSAWSGQTIDIRDD